MLKMNKKNYKKNQKNSILSLPKKYKINNNDYLLDVTFLKDTYNDFMYMTDQEFIDNAPEALHFACYVCWLKNIPTKDVLSDEGLIHSLVHLLRKSTRNFVNLKEIRKNFKETLTIY